VLIRDPQRGAVYTVNPNQPVLVGREDPSSPVRVPCRDPHVSRRHCEIHLTPQNTLRILDLSTYGTFINGQPVQREGHARVGDSLVLGYRYELKVEGSPDTNAATHAGRDPFASGAGVQSSGIAHGGVPMGVGVQGPGTQGAGLGATPSDPTLVKVGQRYRIQGELGRGGMGVVYKAHDELTNNPCAVKVLRSMTPNSEVVERFRREAILAARLSEFPAIVRVFDLGSLPTGELYYAMDYVPGESLHHKVKHGLPLLRGVWLVAQTARAVAYAHSQNVIHRDLKPGNVLVTPEGSVALTDFGVAKAMEQGSGLTATGASLGTPNYMAPEQIQDSKRAGPLADVYGLGGILYTVLTGRPPYEDTRVGTLLKKVQSGLFRPLHELNPRVPQALADLCGRCLAVDAAQRPDSAARVAEMLEEWLEQQASSMSAPVVSPLQEAPRTAPSPNPAPTGPNSARVHSRLQGPPPLPRPPG
jgi:pSer/pThr/pTyr-binding forkhead associated (FHA) protein